jgi:hypothetical protein
LEASSSSMATDPADNGDNAAGHGAPTEVKTRPQQRRETARLAAASPPEAWPRT